MCVCVCVGGCFFLILVGGQSCPMRTRPTQTTLEQSTSRGASDVIGAEANRDLRHLITQRTHTAPPWGPHQRGCVIKAQTLKRIHQYVCMRVCVWRWGLPLAFSQPVSLTCVFDLHSCLLLHQHRAVFVRLRRSTVLHSASDAGTPSSAPRLHTHSHILGHKR